MRHQRSAAGVMVFALLAMVIVLLPGGFGRGLAAPAPDRITVGFVLPLTGVAAAEGGETREGAELAAKVINDAGGIRVGDRRLRVELVFEDDRCSPAGGTETANRLAARRVDFAGGNFCSSAALASQPVFAQAGIPQVIYAFATDLTAGARQKANAAWSVRIGPQAKVEMAPLAKYAVTANNHKKFFAMAQNTDFGRSMITEFRAVLEKLGGSFVAEPEFYPFPGTTDFRTILTKARGSGAEGILAQGLLGEMIGVSLQFRELGLTQGFYGSDLLDDVPYQAAVGERARGLYYPWVYDDGVDARRFQRSEPETSSKVMSLTFLNTLKKRATRNHGWGWGTLMLIQQAVESVGTTDKERVMRRILSGEPFNLPLGTYGFLPCGQADVRVGIATYEAGVKRVLLVDRDFSGRAPVVLTSQDLCPKP